MIGNFLARTLTSAVSGLAIAMLLPPPAQAAVGRTEASYGVTPNGATNYTIPIRATEGINGLTPRISIDYVGPTAGMQLGRKGNKRLQSVLGVGFDLAGLSYIRPCAQTIAQDGAAAPVTLTSADRYCLDGARLRQIGTGTYGAAGTQYRTEVDQLVRVTITAVANGVPSCFQVERPDGMTYEYGCTVDSQLLSGTQAGATPQFWAVSKIYDPDDNAIRFVYENVAASNRFRPNYISYTEVGGTGHYKIAFVYQTATQPTSSVRYTPAVGASARHKEDKLLDRIELKHDDVVYLAYKLTYQAAGGTSQRLWKVQECAYAPNEDCLPATTLTWLSATAGHDALASSGKNVDAFVMPLDINGDGIQDLVWPASGTWRYMLGGPSGFGTIFNTTVAATNPNKAMVLRWNADEFDDLLIDWSDGKWRVLRGGANGFNTTAVASASPNVNSTPTGYTTTVGDLNADGLDDLLQMQLDAPLSIAVRFNGASGFGASSVAYTDPMIRTKGNSLFIKMTGTSSVRRPDFNGDGRTDLLVWGCIWEQELNACIGPPTQWYQLISWGTTFVNQGPIPGANYTIQARFGHFNDDPLTDVIYPNTSGVWSIGYGTGSGLSVTSGPSHAAHVTYQTLVGDYDGDGLDDFYVTKISPSQWEILRSNGIGFDAAAIPTTISGDGLGWMLMDQDGDLPPDLGRYDTSTYLWRVGAHAGDPGDHLLNATDGLSNGVTFSYLPMTDATVYAKGSGASGAMRDVEGDQILVRTMQVSPAGGTSYTLTYKYFTAREHVQGRGYLGMSRREITDSRNSIFVVENYEQDFPYIGALDRVRVSQNYASNYANLKLIQDTNHSYAQHVLSSTAGKERYLPYRSQTVTDVYEVGGVRDQAHVTQITETHTVNTWGNSEFVSVDVEDMDALSPETGQIYRTEVTSTYSENGTNWCIAQPLTRSDKRILPDGTNSTRAASWAVSNAKCRVTQETLEPGGGSLLSLITDISYDSCGNVDEITTQPAGTTGQARVTSIDYGFNSGRCQRPEKITNAEGHVSNIAYNWPLAVPATQTDPNGLITTPTYDGFGRLTRQVRPDATGVRFSLTACTSGNSWCGKNSGARVKVTRTERSNVDNVLRTDEQFLDGLGRVRWTHTESLESGAAIVETLYDAFGRVSQQTQPYFAGGGVYPTVLTRDLIGRVTSRNAPISEAQTTGRITSFTYEGRVLEVTDPANEITTRLHSVLGQLKSLTDPSPGGITIYAYHPFGELKSITDAALNETSWSVNGRGFVDGNSDPDSGIWAYEVNAFGETTKIRDAKTASPAWTTQFTFDKLSRLKTRVEAEGTTTLTWGTSSHNTTNNKYIGRLKQVDSPGGYRETFTFDAYSRLSQLVTRIDAVNYTFNQSYWTATGLPSVRTYPTSIGARLRVVESHQRNLLRTAGDYDTPTTVFWTGNSTDAWGHYQDELFGNGVLTITDFDQASGLMASREAGVGGGTGLINSTTAWADLRGNLTQRQDLKLTPNVTEAFLSGGSPGNDPLSRIDSSTRNGSQNFDVTLNAIGNITAKDGLNYVYTRNATGCTYNFPHLQPRAVHKIGSTVYCYDANGNMTKRAGSNITYASYNLPTVINSGSNSSTLSYGAFRNRYKQVAVTSGATETTIYVAGLFEKVTLPSGVIEYRHYIPGGNGTAAIHTRRSTGINSTFYWHADHLGSPELFTDTGGTVQVRPSFGAYGERRDGSDWLGPPSAGDLTTLAGITRRGFTGHEHLDSVGLIHMNGRVYDPAAGRFLSRDPFIDGLSSSQGVNWYAYVHNNPLTLIDPTGFDSKGKCEPDMPGDIVVCGKKPRRNPRPAPQDPYTPPGRGHDGGDGGDGGRGDSDSDEENGQERRKDLCANVPALPGGDSVDDNIDAAESIKRQALASAGLRGMGVGAAEGLTARTERFYSLVRNSGPWDYKQYGSQFENAGNFNFGATGAALGLPDQILLRGAGWAQQRAGTSSPVFGQPIGNPPYGDDPIDQAQIKEGIAYYNACRSGS